MLMSNYCIMVFLLSLATYIQVTTVHQIIHSVAAGHTILMCQTDKIHECFYDLFNQRFRSIGISKSKDQSKNQQSVLYFANIAIGAHSKPCQVDPKFQCFIILDKDELKYCPSPFLNRFEKYYLCHKSLFYVTKEKAPPCLRVLLQDVYDQVNLFNYFIALYVYTIIMSFLGEFIHKDI